VPGSHRVVDRYYDPTTDQFLSVDPDVVETGQPYAYTGDDPLNATDPLGLMAPTEGDYRYLNHWRQHNQFCRRHPGIRGRSCGGLMHELRGTYGKVRHHVASGYDTYVSDAASTTAAHQDYDDVANSTNELPGAGVIDRAEAAVSSSVSAAVSKVPGANWVDSNLSSAGSCAAGGLLSGGLAGEVAINTVPVVRAYVPVMTRILDDAAIGFGLVAGSALLGCAVGGDVNP
jgi:hypothetical protein